MKKLLISAMIVLVVTSSMAAEKRSMVDVNADALTNETQIILSGAGGDDHLALIWWVPNEYWQAHMAKDKTKSKTDRKAVLDAMSGVSLLSVVQADVTHLGAFKFYSKEEIENKMMVSYTHADGKKQSLSIMQTIDPDLEVLLGAFKPILGAAMGNLGNNMHFYVLNDKSKSSLRLLDPYREGIINIKLANRNGNLVTAIIEMPLNSLFIPRKCPNGKDAHISWKYCPWTGKRLED